MEAAVDIAGVSYRIAAADGDHIGGIIASTGRPYEEELLEVMRHLIRPSDHVLDVGANIGNHALYFALVCDATVDAYEPDPDAIPYLHANVRENRAAGRIRVHEYALGETNTAGTMRARGHTEIDGLVDVRRLDDAGFDDVRLMKIDVEGAEPMVLRGARETLRRCRPVVVAEAGTAAERDAVDAELLPLGYRRFPVAFAITATHVYCPTLRSMARVAVTKPAISRLLRR